MSLPGLGIFTLDKSVVLPEENDRVLLSMPNAVQFQNANIAAADKELITFICENTGKIRPLAISDLDSYLNLGMEMLNIGKPFHLEGIGTITKNRSGKFDFSPGEYTLIKENSSAPGQEKKKVYARDKKEVAEQSVVQNRNGLKIVALISALLIIGIGGWLIYKKNNTGVSEKNADSNSTVQESQPVISDSVTHSSTKQDTSRLPVAETAIPSTVSSQPAIYKFVILATPNKEYALKRYNQLLGFGFKARLYQKDSSFFKVYFQFPALVKDTIHIKDSLRKEFAHSVRIEQ